MKRSVSFIAGLAVLSVLVMNIFLLRSNAALRHQLKALQHTDGPAIGQLISSLNGTDLQNHSLQLPLATQGRKTLLMLYTPACPFCKANWKNWEKLTEDYRDSTDVVWGDLSGDANESFLNGHNLAKATTIRVGPESRDIDAFHVTPTTVLLGVDGKVQGVWLGMLTDENLTDIRGHLK